jgi:hypothetical protein
MIFPCMVWYDVASKTLFHRVLRVLSSDVSSMNVCNSKLCRVYVIGRSTCLNDKGTKIRDLKGELTSQVGLQNLPTAIMYRAKEIIVGADDKHYLVSVMMTCFFLLFLQYL